MTIAHSRLLAFGLSLFGAAATVAAVAIGVKEGQKAKENPVPEDSTKWDKIKPYKNTIILASVAVTAQVAGCVISRRTEGALMGITAATYAGYSQYKDKVKDILGTDAAKKVQHELGLDAIKKDPKKQEAVNVANMTNKKLYRITIDPQGYIRPKDIAKGLPVEKFDNYDGSLTEVWFLSDPVTMHKAWEYCLKLLSTDCEVRGQFSFTLYDLLNEAKVDFVHPTDNNSSRLNWGWDAEYLAEAYGDSWVDIDNIIEKVDDQQGPFVDIVFKQDLIYDPGTNEHGRKVLVGSSKEDLYNEFFK